MNKNRSFKEALLNALICIPSGIFIVWVFAVWLLKKSTYSNNILQISIVGAILGLIAGIIMFASTMKKDAAFVAAQKQGEKKAPAAEPVASKPVQDTASLLEDSVDKLSVLYQGAPEGFLKSQAGAVRQIGGDLNNAGGMALMLQAHEMFAARNPQMARNLEIVWDGIGDWMG